jgi:uncharacterized lipoprotein YddW (UPF0748 family)
MHQMKIRAGRALLVALLAFTALSACYRRADVYPGLPWPDRRGTAATPGGHDAAPATTQEGDAAAAAAAPDAAPAVAAYRAFDGPMVLPGVAREFRGVWVATVGNMDWPSRRNLGSAQAQAELLRILDTARDLGLNAVIFQVRPMADAFYASTLEPWSDYLTGASGRAPEPFWDPLQFAIEQAHARGLELHAWFNPFRAGFVAKQTPMAQSHVSKRRPDLVRRYGDFFWMDPGEPDARRQALDVIADVARRYDVDGIHIDDYFYPYQQRDARGRLIPFPDDRSWERYGRATGLGRNDWRRSNIDTFVQQMYDAVRSEKPHVRVGISPFGIWRPGHPESVRGLDSWAELYADTRKWLLNGWADYYAPQLYWRTHAPQQRYTELLQWWSEQNPHGRHIWAGNIPNNIAAGSRPWSASEVLEQVQLTREHAGATGNIHFSASALLRNPDGLGDAFRTSVYAAPALVPASPWLGSTTPQRPVLSARLDDDRASTRLELAAAEDRVHQWIVHVRTGDAWRTRILPAHTRELDLVWENGRAPDALAVIAVDRIGVEGPAAVLVLHGATRSETGARTPAGRLRDALTRR